MTDPSRTRVEHWKLSLLELTASNDLLAVHDGPTTVPLPWADPVALAAALAAAQGFAIESATAAVPGPGPLRTPVPAAELERRLVTIWRRARARLADAGVHEAWLGLGALTWCATDGAAHSAPLLLWPVELERSAAGMRVASAGPPCLNGALVEKLRRDFELVLAATDDVAALLESAEAIAVTRPGWRVERGARLGLFAVADVAIWQDLEACGDVFASPVVAHLAAGSGAAFAQPSALAAAAVVAAAGAPAATEVMAPLDADASQIAAVAAAGAGASFVVQGAPGSGKSQTIANLIVDCVSQGKTVLFVSTKVAALEVVQQRLAAVGLGEFCLELSAHLAQPAPLVQQLARVLERSFRPGAGGIGDDARLAELRAALDAHVAALHRVGPFGRSLHEALARLVELRTAPRAELAERDATGLDRGGFDRRKRAVEHLAAAAIPIEPVAAHAWRASTMERWPLDGRDRAIAALDEAAAAAAALAGALHDVAAVVPGVVARTHDELVAVGAFAALAATSPRPGAELLTQLRSSRGEDIGERVALIRARGTGSVEVPRDPVAFLAVASKHRALLAEVDERFTDAVAELDAPALWAQLRTWTARMAPFRYVALRTARAAIRAAAVPGALHSDDAMITALEAVIAERACRAALAAAAEPALRWFGDLGGDPLALDLAKIDAAVGWAAELRHALDRVAVTGGDPGRAAAWRALVAQIASGPTSGSQSLASDLAVFARLAAAVTRWAPALTALADATGIAAPALAAGDDHLAALRERTELLRHSIDGLREWVAFHAARGAALTAGVGPAVAAIERGDLGAEELAAAWERATLLAWADAELAEQPALARFHGAAHHAHVAAFADLDRGALALARSRALVRLAERVPRIPRGASDAPEAIEAAVLADALRRTRDRRSGLDRAAIPLRPLFAAIPNLLPKLAPCMLMTPASVAAHLDPALPRFDVVVFDEASQLPLAEAIGALARGRSAIVVGDSRQLSPPPPEESRGAYPVRISLLDACIAARLPELRLACHYRSKHEDLFAFANERYYADRLQILPAAHGSPDLGIAWRRVEGAFDRAAGHHRGEAEAIVADVVARLRDPAQRTRSIAVVTFSRAQQELIEDLFDDERLRDPVIEAAFELDPMHRTAGEPVLVKTCHRAQGDERDVVLVSVGAGPDGELAQPHGDGARHLNVAITRAREQLVVFSSVSSAELAAAMTEATPSGVRDLAALLAFAQASGGAARPTDDAAAASAITAAIARALAERGWIVRHRVGCGAYHVDLAVVDPNDADRYVLAIEHDGAGYASAPAARDRDRLRAQALGALGWRLHRVWTLDWWADPDREVQRAHGAIVAAIAASRQRRPTATPTRPRIPARRDTPVLAAGSTPVVRIPPKPASGPLLAAGSGPTDAVLPVHGGATTRVRLARGAIAIGPYAAAAIPPGRRTPDDLFALRHVAELGKVVEQVLAAEAPMHLDLLARRVGGYFGIGRVTQRVTDQVRTALAGRGRFGDEPDVVWRLDQDPAAVPAVRVAGQGPSARREIGEVPLSELASAARIVVERAAGLSAADLVRDAARLLGFARITEQVTERVAQGVALASARSLIRIDGGKAVMPSD